jgi:hypothetical protein
VECGNFSQPKQKQNKTELNVSCGSCSPSTSFCTEGEKKVFEKNECNKTDQGERDEALFEVFKSPNLSLQTLVNVKIFLCLLFNIF